MQSEKGSIKKIWILNHHAETPKTGTGTRHYDFARELIKRGHRVTMFASSHIHYTDVNVLGDNESYRIVEEDGIEWIWINTIPYTSNGIKRILGMVQYYFKVLKLSKKLQVPNVVIGSAVHLLACLAAYKLSLRYKIKFISEIRDLWPETLIQMGRLKRNSILAKTMGALEKFIYKKSDNIIITAPGMKDYIESLGINTSKIVYINNGLDAKAFDLRCESEYDEDEQCKLPVGKFNVVYTGGHGLANDLETAIKAAKILQDSEYDDIYFSFFGEGPLKDELIKKVEELQLDNIKFNALVPKYCVPKILRNADTLLVLGKNLDLYKYGVSMNKLFEYLYSGVPIVFSMNTINDYVEQTGDGYSITPECSDEMAEAIIKLYRSTKEERNLMGQRGIKFVKENFDIPVLVDTLEKIIEE